MRRLIPALAALALLQGCANLTLRPRCEYNQGPYFCTRTVNRLVARGFDGKPVERMFLPVLFVDWPFDALADTLLWPWDAVMGPKARARFGAGRPSYPYEGEWPEWKK